MRRLVAAVILVASVWVWAGTAHAEQAFVLVRLLPNGNEQVIATADTSLSTDAAIQELRQELLAEARGRLFTNPGHRYVIYGPTEDDTPRTIDDRVWDSAVDL